MSQRLNSYYNYLYSLWVSNFLGKVGGDVSISIPLLLLGGGQRNVTIGSHTRIAHHAIIGCWECYDHGHNKQFTPYIIIGDNCSLGEYCHITAIRKITIGNGLLTGRFVYIGDNSHGGLSLEEADIPPLNRELYSKGEIVIGNNVIITKNVIFQVTELDNQTNSNYTDISIIDLGECTQKLKDFYKIPEEESLIINKADIKTSNFMQIYVQYEIYNPINLEKLNLSICEDSKISIYTKINLDNSTISLYNNLKESGYNLFNKTDSFYTDVCSIYTSENSTDIALFDRNTEIFEKNGNISLCQTGCELNYFNSITKEIKCDCSPQTNKMEAIFSFSDNKFAIQIFVDSIFSTIKNSNILVLKCYKLTFETKNLTKNYGRIIMTIIVTLSFILLLIFIFCDFKKIDTYLLIILNNNRKYGKNMNNMKKNKNKMNKLIKKKGKINVNKNAKIVNIYKKKILKSKISNDNKKGNKKK